MRKFRNYTNAYPSTKFQGLPASPGNYPYHMNLADVHTVNSDEMVVHTVGDTGGIKDPYPQISVANVMEQEKPAFFYILGDVVYFTGEAREYYPQFYEPYQKIDAPIFAIPGNHDGATLDPINSPSLKSFINNFCATQPVITHEALDAQRDAMTQPNVYWTLESPFFTWIGLYTNVPEGGVVERDQQNWFNQEIDNAPKDKFLIVALHHPPYSSDGHHGGSDKMRQVINEATTSRFPDLILTGHVHNYQRFSLKNGCPCIVAGNGGYHNLYKVNPNFSSPDATLERFNDTDFGFLRLTFTKNSIKGEEVTANSKVFDTFNISKSS